MKPFSILDEPWVVPLTAATASSEALLGGAGLPLLHGGRRLLSAHRHAIPHDSEHHQGAYQFHGVPFVCRGNRCRSPPVLPESLVLRQRAHDIQRREHPEKTVPILDHGQMMDAVLDHDPRGV
jgi:hypothetical protein